MVIMKKVILIFVGYYIPGFKAGGPLRTIANLVDYLDGDFEFRIVTRDRDLGDLIPYPSIQVDRWNQVGNTWIFYASKRQQNFTCLIRLINSTPHDLIYLNDVLNVCEV